MTFKIQIELWVGLCINFTSELVIQALTQNPKSKIRFWILFFRNPKSDFGFQGDHAFQKVLLHSNTPHLLMVFYATRPVWLFQQH